jgi:N-acetylglucosaminyldiphosphoundecaprenol N-acetyl-beta-D-mannosaminyltransferase
MENEEKLMLEMNMKDENLNKNNPVNIFGVPVDNLSMDCAIDRILALAEQYKVDQVAKHVITLNVDFLMNSLNWRTNGPERHPELFEVLQKADLVTADGMPIVWLSRLLNAPINSRVTGADIVPELSRKIAETGHSVYFLGGNNDVAKKASDALKKEFPGLNVVGYSSPYVLTEGEEMFNSQRNDVEILDEINSLSPDILLVGFGNPKQELWFNRNRHNLKVGVTIGIGGTYEFITGNVSRAPGWVQNSGFEWVYRIIQDPKRLWKRYALGIPKLAYITASLLINHYRHVLSSRYVVRQKKRMLCDIQPSVSDHVITISLSRRLDFESMIILIKNWEKEMLNYKKIQFDFIDVEYIDAIALGMLIRLFKQIKLKNIQIETVGIVNENIISLFKATRVWDVINNQNAINTEINKMDTEQLILSDKISVKKENENELAVQIKLYGRLDASSQHFFDSLCGVVFNYNKHIIFDFNELNFLDSTGLRLFFQVKKDLDKINKKIIFFSVNDNIKQLLKITKLDNYFTIVDDYQDALAYLG